MSREIEAAMIEEALFRPDPGRHGRPRLTSAQVESAVRAARLGGVRVLRVVVDHDRGRIEIEAAAEDAAPVRSFDTIDFRAGP